MLSKVFLEIMYFKEQNGNLIGILSYSVEANFDETVSVFLKQISPQKCEFNFVFQCQPPKDS